MATWHPDKAINAAIEAAVAAGWRFRKAGPRAHVFGELYCPESSREGCIVRVFSTPRVPEAHAKDILRRIARCPHPTTAGDEEE